MHIFISHHHSDAKELASIKKYFKDILNIDSFLAHTDINPGEHDLECIEKMLKEAKMFVYIGSDQANKSIFCQQEIGMAKALNKIIVPTHKNAPAQAFLQRIQSIKYTDFNELRNKLVSAHKFHEVFEKKVKNHLNRFFNDDDKHQKRYFKKGNPNNWDDLGYKITIELITSNNITIPLKMAYKGQQENETTFDKLPDCFPYSRNIFFSYVEDKGLDISADQKKSLRYLLNDVREMDHRSLQSIINEPVLKYSVLRNHEKLFEQLKDRASKSTQ